ncbi:MAG: tetratricopeptide repeat protein [Spirochaetes bacterium]|nr:tetratricopeptide repeat protein [Spirochaetota bacterium]
MSGNHTAVIPAMIVCALLSISWLDPYRDAVSSGNEEFNQKKYNNAKRYYEKAEKYAPGEDEKKKLAFNKADADYMLEDADNALTGYQRAVQSDNRDVQKKAFFNAGNVYLKQKNYREAINAYMNALKIDPGYERAKKNIEYVLKHMNQDKKDNKNNKDKKDNGKDRNKSGQDEKNQDQKQENRQRDKNNRGENSMSREQVKNILRSLQQSPVRRQKGSGDEKRKLEKYW